MPLSALVVRTWIMALPPPGSVDGVTCAVRMVFSGKPNCGHWLTQVVQEAAAELPPQQAFSVHVNEVWGPLGPTASNPGFESRLLAAAGVAESAAMARASVAARPVVPCVMASSPLRARH
jgi:hypothetical protein